MNTIAVLVALAVYALMMAGVQPKPWSLSFCLIILGSILIGFACIASLAYLEKLLQP